MGELMHSTYIQESWNVALKHDFQSFLPGVNSSLNNEEDEQIKNIYV